MSQQLQPRAGFTLPSLLAVLLMLAIPLLSSAQDQHDRLILKDGSYQLVTKYEVKGNRVRYFSSERDEWEELPASLVDWPATEKYQRDLAAGTSTEAVQFDKDLEHEREVEEGALPEVAPGLRLPEDSGVFLLDTFQSEPQLVELQQTSGDLNRNTKGNILYGAINPISGLKQMIELQGGHARVQSHADVPSLYIDLESIPGQANQTTGVAPQSSERPQQPQQPEQARVPFDRFRILRADVKGNKRILGDVKRAVTGKVTQEQHFVATTVTEVAGGWLKLTPTASLAPGEYALVEMVGEEGMNLDVWDFGVNPKAPENANAWKPEGKPAATAPATPATPASTAPKRER